jgi:hypothetical protein
MDEENERISPETVMEMLGIKKTQYYARLNKLGIKPARKNGKAYLTNDQLEQLRDYKEPSQNALATVDTDSELIIGSQDAEQMTDNEQDDIWRSAAELKAQQMSLGDLVKIHLAAGMKFEDLPEDLKEQVRSVNQAANPDIKKSAASIASQMLDRYRQK